MPPCTFTQGFWKNHPTLWPVSSLTLGGHTYNENQLIALMQLPSEGDASLNLADHLAVHGPLPAVGLARLLNLLDAVSLTGRGGAGFPFAAKLRALPAGTRPAGRSASAARIVT